MRLLSQILFSLVILLTLGLSASASPSYISHETIYNQQLAKANILLNKLSPKQTQNLSPAERYKINNEFAHIFRDTEFEVKYIKEMISAAEEMGDNGRLLYAYVCMCRNNYETDNYHKVGEWAQKTSTLSKQKGSHYLIASYYFIEALIWNGDIRSAWKSLQELSQEISKWGSPSAVAITKLLTADIYTYTQQPDKAISTIKEYLPILKTNPNPYVVQLAYTGAIEASIADPSKDKEIETYFEEWETNIANIENEIIREDVECTLNINKLIYYFYSNNIQKAEHIISTLWDNNRVPSNWDMQQFLYYRTAIRFHNQDISMTEKDMLYLLKSGRRSFFPEYYALLGAAYHEHGLIEKAAEANRKSIEEKLKGLDANAARNTEQYSQLAKQFKEESAIKDLRLRDNQLFYKFLTIATIVVICAILLLLVILHRNIQKNRTLKQLSNELTHNQEKLSALNETLAAAISEEEKSNIKKNEFIANISHEIRTPLNAIVGFSDILASSFEDNSEEYKGYTDIIRSNSDLMLDLVDQIINKSPSDEVANLTIESENIVELGRNSLNSINAIIKEGVKLFFICDHKEINLYTDRYRLQQLLSNILGNAAKFTESGSITLEISKDDEFVTFSVTDTGCGIAEGMEDAIFGRFEKESETSQGFGLGLYICRTISNKLKGSLFLDRSYTAGGARFIFKHPTTLKDELIEKGGEA